MKKLILSSLFVLFAISVSNAQSKYFTKNGNITFEASVPAFEEVKATNNKVTAILKSESGSIAALALVKGFRFKIALMEEHFNENYAESDKYPKAKFSGNILNFSLDSYEEGKETKIQITGKLTFHGVTNEINIEGTLTKSGDNIKIISNFSAKASDYQIDIPKIVSSKVAKDIDIQLNLDLKKK